MTAFLDTNPDLADLIRVMSVHGVRYLVVGGHAVGVHSKPRATKDLDLWIDGGNGNKKLVVDALADFGAPAEVGRRLMMAGPDEVVWFGRAPNRVDFLQSLPGVHDFSAALQRALWVRSSDQRIPIISAEDLIQNKETVARPQDKLDVALLRKYLRATNKD